MAIGIVMGIALAACSPSVKVPEPEVAEQSRSIETPSSELCAIDSLMWRQPDSALAQLQRFVASPAADSLDVFNGHYCQLLISELLYKNDWGQSNRGELLRAVAYFDSLSFTLNDIPHARRRHCGPSFRECGTQSPNRSDNIVFLTARAHYINGVGYYEHDSVVEACKEYLKALEVMEEHFEEKDLAGEKAKFMALTYTRLTDLFSDLYFHEQAIYFGKLSLAYYQKYDAKTGNVAWMLNNIGSHYDIMSNYDSAYYYYNQGISVLTDTNSLIYRGIATHLSFLSYKMGGSPSFLTNELHKLLVSAKSNQEYASRCLTIGEIFYHEWQFDSAWYYLNIAYNQTNNVPTKKQAAEWLVEIGEAHGKSEEASEFALFLVPFANMEENQSATKSQLAELYNEYRQAQLQQQQHNEAKKHAKQLLWTIVGLLIIVTPILIISHRRNKKQKQDLETQIEAERHSHQMQQAALSGRLKRSNAALKEKSLSSAAIPMSKYSPQYTQVENYAEEPICKQILSTCNDKNKPIKSTVPVSAYADIALSDAQKAELGNVALRHYGQLFDKLKERYPELKGKDLLYCQLSLLGLDNTQIAVLLQKSISTIWERENRLKKIFGSEDNVSVILHKFLID